MSDQELTRKAGEIYEWCTNGINQPSSCLKDIFELAKDFAAIRDAEIVFLKAKMERYRTLLSSLGATHFAEMGAANHEITQLKADISRIVQREAEAESKWREYAEGKQDQVEDLKAEIERLKNPKRKLIEPFKPTDHP